MARSYNIYVVTAPTECGAESRPVAAFTVKHELESWVKRNQDKFDLDADIFIMKDNPPDL
jgi:hypothetical protein